VHTSIEEVDREMSALARSAPVSRSAASAVDPVPRAVAVVGLVTVAAIHFGQVVPTVQQTPYLGAAFVVVTVACILLAGRLLLGDTRMVWLQVGAVNLLSIGGYAFTRMFSTFIDRGDAGHWSETLGLVALLVEGSLVLLCVLQIFAGTPAPSATTRHRNP
jgi:hypothetical protein